MITIGLVNKSGAVLAAGSTFNKTDDAVSKQTNNIFKPYDGRPVGVMIDEDAQFMGIPMRQVMLDYQYAQNTGRFGTLKEYVMDFVGYLQNKAKSYSEMEQEECVRSVVSTEFLLTNMMIEEMCEDKGIGTTAAVRELAENVIGKKYEYCMVSEPDPSVDENYEKSFRKKYEAVIKDSIKEAFNNVNFSKKTEEELTQLGVCLFSKSVPRWYNAKSPSLMFAGYGDAEELPQIYSLRIFGVADYRVKHDLIEHEFPAIDDNIYSVIAPFVSSEAILNFVNGIDPEYEINVMKALYSALNEYHSSVVDELEKLGIRKNNKIYENIINKRNSSIDKPIDNIVAHEYSSHQKPFHGKMATLSKNEMASLAEALIRLAFLKYEFSGRIDTSEILIEIASITKEEGVPMGKEDPSNKAAEVLAG